MKQQRVLVSAVLIVALVLGMAGMAAAGKVQNQLGQRKRHGNHRQTRFSAGRLFHLHSLVTFIKRVLPKAQVRLFDDASAAYLEVINGKAHASLNDAPEPAFQALKYPEVLYMPLAGKKLTHEPIGFALHKGDPDWPNYLNNWITFQHSKPWMQDRYRYWFESREWENLIQ